LINQLTSLYSHSLSTDNSLLRKKRSHIYQTKPSTKNSSRQFTLQTVPPVKFCWVFVLLLVVKDCIRARLWK